jgi:hypothetical protein
MGGVQTEDFKFESKVDVQKKPDGTVNITKTNTTTLGTEDIFAGIAGLIALVIALGIVFGKVPLNELSAGVLSFSGVGTAIVGIIKARNKGGGGFWIFLGVIACLLGIALVAWLLLR